jgi:hypothetical protein
LLTLIELKDKKLAKDLEESIELGIYAIAYRYPDAQKKELTSQIVLNAISIAEKIYNRCSREINKD